MTDAIGPATDRFLLAVAAIGILLVTGAFLLPATIDLPASAGAGPQVDLQGAEAEEVSGAPGDAEYVSEEATQGERGSAAGGDSERSDLELAVDASATGGLPIPGRSIVVTASRDGEGVDDATITMDGVRVGTTLENGTAEVPVPPTESVVLAAEAPNGETVERSLDVSDDVDLLLDGAISRSEGAPVHVSVEGYDLRGATVTVDGEDVATTHANGTATVDVPDGAESIDLGIEYGELGTERTVSLDLQVDVDAFYPAAGSGVGVDPTYGQYDADAHVYVVAGDASQRADDVVEDRAAVEHLAHGYGHVRLPAASTATLVVTDGHEVEAVTLDGLLQNLAIVIVVTLSLAGGMTVTTLRVLRWLEFDVGESGFAGGALADLIAGVGTAILGVAGGIASLAARIRLPRVPVPSLPSVSLPALRLPRVSAGALLAPVALLGSLRLPSFRLPSLGVPQLSLPSLPSLGRPTLDGGDEPSASEPTAVVDPFDPAADDEDGTPRLTERELVRAAVRDLGRLADVRRIETNTPGQIGRRALDRALPRAPVRAIVATVREVEYGGGEATSAHASRVRDAVRRLRDAVAEGGDES